MLKFGLLCTNQGRWKNQQIISQNWIERSLQFYFTAVADSKTYYSYQFWGANVNINNSQVKAFGAWGNGGQWIVIVPSLELVVVAIAGNYNNPSLSDQAYDMIANEIIRQ